jgi:hypothetical protein
MKNITITMAVIFILTIGLGGILLPAQPALAQEPAKASSGELSEDEIEALILMREEEKLARDVYKVLYETWGAQIFLNIQASEQTHFDQIGVLLERYDLQDPALDYGVFADHHLQELYDLLISIGTTSLADAYWVGATIEDYDIYDLIHCLAVTDNKDIRQVFTNLMEGSYNHLRGYVYCLSTLGMDYTPQYITVELFNEILAGETGGAGAPKH